MDLKLVQMIRGAMRAADQGAAAVAGGACGVPTASTTVIERRFHHQPDVFIKSRPVITPEPRYLPRVVYHPSRIQTQPAPAPIVIEVMPECDCTNKCDSSPLPPPWKMPLCEKSSQPAPRVKIVVKRPDVIHKGSLIDFFI